MSRDVLAPPLQRLSHNRCYRVNLIHDELSAKQRNQHGSSSGQQTQAYTEPDLYTDDYDDAEEDECDIEELAGGSFKLSMHVPNSFYGGIIGFKGSTKRRIETETRTEINVPRNREGMKLNENIVIKGKSRESLLAARRQLNILIGSLRARMKPTHFIGIALRGTEVQNKFKDFKREVLALQLAGINENLFQDDERIHITLGVCVLLDDLERKKAVDLLEASRDLLEDGCNVFNIKVNGLEIMNDDPSSVGVLYACVESPELQQFANRLMAPFEKAALSFDKFEREGVKLHMTLMNKRYGTDNFDARELLKKYGDFDFGTAQCNEVLLCVIKDKKEKGEFYRTTGKLKL